MNVTVPIVSAATSKVNWIAGVSAALVSANEILNQVAPILPPPYGHYATIAIAVIGGISTIIARTFYTTSITPSSAVKVDS